ncbi:MAG TPA: acylphosphatase [Bryobacteraceae bacterium]|jgi:acylphosphatase
MGALLARRYYITGQVQGVGYRYFAQNVARGLRIRGWARNLDDGRVEVLGIGTPRQLEDFEGELRVGPPRAEVRGIAVEEAATPAAGVTGFYIR